MLEVELFLVIARPWGMLRREEETAELRLDCPYGQ
jgi:hypothetical protein